MTTSAALAAEKEKRKHTEPAADKNHQNICLEVMFISEKTEKYITCFLLVLVRKRHYCSSAHSIPHPYLFLSCSYLVFLFRALFFDFFLSSSPFPFYPFPFVLPPYIASLPTSPIPPLFLFEPRQKKFILPQSRPCGF